VNLSFTDGALNFIVEKSVDFKLGARGLRSIVEAILNDAMYEVPSDSSTKELKVTRAYAIEKLQKNNLAKLRVA
jgi:ATP-dependent Clp protease ATP-binding subunit ClpX